MPGTDMVISYGPSEGGAMIHDVLHELGICTRQRMQVSTGMPQIVKSDFALQTFLQKHFMIPHKIAEQDLPPDCLTLFDRRS
jgi:hypothetical protein